jgi:hypothetical protein
MHNHGGSLGEENGRRSAKHGTHERAGWMATADTRASSPPVLLLLCIRACVSMLPASPSQIRQAGFQSMVIGPYYTAMRRSCVDGYLPVLANAGPAPGILFRLLGASPTCVCETLVR